MRSGKHWGEVAAHGSPAFRLAHSTFLLPPSRLPRRSGAAMVDPDSSESMDNSRSSRSTSPDTPTSSEGFPAHSPATLPFLNLDADAFHSSRSFKDDLDINAWPILAGDSQLAAPSPPFLFNELSYPFMEPYVDVAHDALSV
jgi:hypothetical protein